MPLDLNRRKNKAERLVSPTFWQRFPRYSHLFQQYKYELNYPAIIGGFKVVGIRDLTIGYDSDTQDNYPTLPVDAATEMITFTLDNGCVFTIRTSGTEPKIKYYCELAGS